MPEHKGNVFVLSAPSGAGKSTVANRLLGRLPGIHFSISYTTRKPREGEQDGVHYFFVDDPTFDRMVADGAFIEWVEVYGRRYGTSRPWIEEQLAKGVDILLDIETKGARNVRKVLPDAEMVFLLPPSAEALAQRLRGRGTDSEDQIRTRLGHARHEMEQMDHYDYLIVNEEVPEACRQLESIVLAARARRARMTGMARNILKSFQEQGR